MIKHLLTNHPNYNIKSFKEYNNDILIKEEYYNENGRYHGIIKYWFPNGNLMFKVKYKNGKFNGIQKYYWENKNLLEERTYNNNNININIRNYYASGKIKSEINFKFGKAITIIYYDEDNGKIIPYNALAYKMPNYVHNCVHYLCPNTQLEDL